MSAATLTVQRMPRAFEERALSVDSQLLLAARRRDPMAFEALVRRHQTPVYNFCLRMLGQPDDAADVAQETFVQLYGHLGRLDEREPLAPWLFRVARNRCIDVIRRRRTVPWQMHDANEDDVVAHEPADQEQLEAVGTESVSQTATQRVELGR
jgi:RNA polymerase sigma factor (sigma-70 family)